MIKVELDIDSLEQQIINLVNKTAEKVAGINIEKHENIEDYLSSIFYSVKGLEKDIKGYRINVDKYTRLVEGMIKQEADPSFMLNIFDEISDIKKENQRIESDMNEMRKQMGVGSVFE